MKKSFSFLTFFLVSLFCIIIFLPGCITSSYYISPMYGSSMSYRTMPLQKDTVKSALYLNSALTYGGTNEDVRDVVYSLQTNIYNVHRFSFFKAWYGAGITLGNYKVHSYSSATYANFDVAAVNRLAGNKFFGSTNFNGGLVIVIPMKSGSEFRVAGVSASLQNEFGDYLRFRKTLEEDTIKITGLAANRALGTIGISSEVALKTKSGAFSIQYAWNILTGKNYSNTDYLNIAPKKRYSYLSGTLALTVNNITGYLQSNLGTRLLNLQTGVNYRINYGSKKRK